MRITLSLFFGLFLSVQLFSQESEVGIFVGTTTLHGDLVDGVVDFQELGVGYGAFYRFYMSPKFSFRAGLTAGTFTSDDANSDTRALRGYASEATIVDFIGIGEWNILGVHIYGETAYNKNVFSPYILFGAGGAMYDVTVTTNGNELHPLDARQSYPDYALILPFGAGLKYVTPRLTIALEASIRAGLTDYLDGISKSGDADHNDWYGFYGVNAAYRIGNERYSSSKRNEEPKEMEEFESSDTYDSGM